MSILLALTAALLCAFGTYLILQRQLSRIVVGIGLLGHGANVLLILSAGGRGAPAFGGEDGAGSYADPLPQALVLTAIVITFGVIAFLLSLAYRSWVLTGEDDVEDDLEDRLVVRSTRLAAEAETPVSETATHEALS